MQPTSPRRPKTPASRPSGAASAATVGTAQVGKAALLIDDVRAMLAALPDTTAGIRDRALSCSGFAGAFRRSELVALDVADVELAREGAIVTIRRSKTDQEGEGQKVGIPRGKHAGDVPGPRAHGVAGAARRPTGPIFRAVDRLDRIRPTRLSDKDVARIVKRAAPRPASTPSRYAGHSLRAGLATSAAIAGVEERQIMAQTRHRASSWPGATSATARCSGGMPPRPWGCDAVKASRGDPSLAPMGGPLRPTPSRRSSRGSAPSASDSSAPVRPIPLEGYPLPRSYTMSGCTEEVRCRPSASVAVAS